MEKSVILFFGERPRALQNRMILEQIYTDIPEEQRHIASLSSTQATENCLTKGHGLSGGALRGNREEFISELEVAKLASKSGLVCA